MKKHFIQPILGIAALLLIAAGCSKDIGSYSYHEINEVSIAGIKNTYAVITAVDTLRIQPELTSTENEAEKGNYDYFWIVRGDDNFLDTVSKETTLDYPINLIPGIYKIQFRVMDKTTGISWWKNSEITVGTPYSRGILLIGENDQGNAEASMLSMVADTLLVQDILANSGLPALKGGIDFLYTSGWEDYKKLWVFTASGSYYLDRLSMKGDINNKFGKQVYTTDPIELDLLEPIVLAPQIRASDGALGTDYMRAMLCSDGSIFTSYLLLNGGDFYTNAMNRLSSQPEKFLKAAPYLLYSIGNMNSLTWYDTENKRFLNISNIGLSTASELLPDAEADPFPWDQAEVGRDLVYAENTRNTDGGSVNGNSFAILKDKANAHYIYEFYGYSAKPAKRAMFKVLPIATDFDKADYYAFSSKRTVIVYAVGHNLYSYDYNPGHEKFYAYPELSGDEITMLKFDTQMDYLDNSLYIATYNDNTKGRLRRFQLGSNPNTVQLQAVDHADWQGLIKIRNMNWRSAN